ncbi:MAG: rod shape-determining protein MreC [Actinomycetota bacterium]|nr:rod shape-determining protein MreC [Actinomycetota bacterium]
MAPRRRSGAVLVLLVLAALGLLTVDYRQHGGVPRTVRRGALVAVGPAQEGAAALVRPIGGLVDEAGRLLRLRWHNAVLSRRLLRMRGQRRSLRDVERENRRLRSMLGMERRRGYRTVAARVIAKGPSTFDWTALIDAGADRRLRPGMAVLAERSLAGTVVAVTRRHGRIEYATSPKAGYAVRVAATGQDGLLTGGGERPYRLQTLGPRLRPGLRSEVVTRAYAGSFIPDGITVGRLLPGRRGRSEQRRRLVEPALDATAVDLVQVVVGAPRNPSRLRADDVLPRRGPRPPSVAARP